jgi:hypothetical protein
MKDDPSRNQLWPARLLVIQDRGSEKRGTVEFFSILTFLIIILKMNSVKRFFLNLTLLNRTNPSGVTYKRVVPVHLA